jgi:hypothetical protein
MENKELKYSDNDVKWLIDSIFDYFAETGMSITEDNKDIHKKVNYKTFKNCVFKNER